VKPQHASSLLAIVAVLLSRLALKSTQKRFLGVMLSVWLALPGRVNAQNLARYSGWSERTFRRWMHVEQTSSSWLPVHCQVVLEAQSQGVIGQEFILAVDASFIRKSGHHTPGLGSFWNGCASRSERGLELSCAALIDVTTRQAFSLEVRQTQAKGEAADRLTQYQAQLEEVLTFLADVPTVTLQAVVADGQYAKTQFMDTVRAHGHTLISKLQKNANLMYLYQGEHPKRRGPKQRYDGKVNWNDLSRFEVVEQHATERILTQEVWAPHFQRRFRIVVIQKLNASGGVKAQAILWSTDPEMKPLTVLALYRARFEIEFMFRDAKQFTGLNTCQLRSTSGLESHWNTSLLVVSLMRLQALQVAAPGQNLVFSLEDIKRRAYNTLYARHILSHLRLEARFGELESNASGTLDFGLKAV
jgi:putative transposase